MFTPQILINKAAVAYASAVALLELGDVDGACNRAYYAMFDAARAALLATAPTNRSDVGKTHSGLIHAFSEHLVKTGKVAKDVGRYLKRAEEMRLIADYRGDSVELADARQIVEQASLFLETMRRIIGG